MAEIPSWLRPFLEGNYFAHCRAHISSKSERNHFCVDCVTGPLCHSGWQEHTEHRTLQVRRASHMDAVRINDIHKMLDTSGIQPYTINGAKIIFLLSRPQSKLSRGGGGGSSSPHRCCEICGRSISDPVRFCSISCKLACVRSGYDDTPIVHPEDIRQGVGLGNGEGCSRIGMKRGGEEVRGVLGLKRSRLHIVVGQVEVEDGMARPGSPINASPNSVLAEMVTPSTCRSMPSPSTPRSHRKGTPYRSPLF